MKKITVFITFIASLFIFCCSSSQKESPEEISEKTLQTTGAEVDTKKIEKLIGTRFEILKTEAIGYSVIHKFLWICVYKDFTEEKILNLAENIIKEITTQKPNTYHSFTIHFFIKEDIVETLENSKSFARAEFLPFGDWLEVDRTPISDYKDYKLECTFFIEK